MFVPHLCEIYEALLGAAPSQAERQKMLIKFNCVNEIMNSIYTNNKQTHLKEEM